MPLKKIGSQKRLYAPIFFFFIAAVPSSFLENILSASLGVLVIELTPTVAALGNCLNQRHHMPPWLTLRFASTQFGVPRCQIQRARDSLRCRPARQSKALVDGVNGGMLLMHSSEKKTAVGLLGLRRTSSL